MDDPAFPRLGRLGRRYGDDCYKMSVALLLDLEDAGRTDVRLMKGRGRRGMHWWVEDDSTALDPKHGVVEPVDEYLARTGVRGVEEDPPTPFVRRFVARLAGGG